MQVRNVLASTASMRLRVACVRPHYNIARMTSMKLMKDLFSTDYGLMSVAVIVITLGMAVWFRAFFKRKMNESAKDAGV
jgi:C4-dicarboxylate transporter